MTSQTNDPAAGQSGDRDVSAGFTPAPPAPRPWRGWARRHRRERWEPLAEGDTEDEAAEALQEATAGWRVKDTLVTASGQDPNAR